MPSYCVPVEDLVPPTYVAPDRYRPVPALAQRLFRHYKRRAGGRNVYLLADGTLTTAQPADYSTVARVYFAGHIEQVTVAELAALVAAGYPSAC